MVLSWQIPGQQEHPMAGSSSPDVPSRRLHTRWRWLTGGLAVAAVGVCVGLAIFVPVEDLPVAELGPLACVALVAIQAATVVVFPVPAWPVTAVDVFLYGPWVGFGLTHTGTVLGSVGAFLLGRRFGWALVKRTRGIRVHAAKLERSEGLWLIPVLMLPLPIGGDIACFVAGLSGIRCRRVVWLACVGRVPGAVLGVLFATGLANGSIALVVAAAALLTGLLLFARRWRAEQSSSDENTVDCVVAPRGGTGLGRWEKAGETPGLIHLSRPVAFAFGAGGSHGAVQVGQLRALREFGVCPDLLVGCSVGALNAAVVAVEPDNAPQRLDNLWKTIRANDIFSRPEPPMRERRAVFGNDGLRRLLETHFSAGERLETLALPLCVVVTARESRRSRVLSEGELVPALLASCAIPLVLPSVTIDGTSFVDGGIRHDLPIAEAFGLGAASVVALPTTRWPNPIGYRSSMPTNAPRVLVLGGAANPGTGWVFSRADQLAERGYWETVDRLSALAGRTDVGTDRHLAKG